MPAAMGPASTMESATAVESASAAVKATADTAANAAMSCVAAAIAATGITAHSTAPITIAAPVAIPPTVTVAEARAAIEAAPVKAVIPPRSGADEDAAYEPIRAVIAIGRAGIRVIAIIPVGASRSGADTCVNRANADADAHLSLCIAGGKKQYREQRNIF